MILVDNIHKSYGDLPVLNGISLEVKSGEIVSVVGPSGCGKTTLMRIVAGLVPATSGTTLINERSSEEVRTSGKLGYVFQSPVLLPWRSVLENVSLPLDIIRREAVSVRRESAMAILERMGLASFANSAPYQLSGGMRQRVAIARALVFEPSTLLMDEPFSALDELMRETYDLELRDLTKDLNQTVLFITHSLWEAALLSDRVIVLSSRPAHVKKVVEIGLCKSRRTTIGSDRHMELVRDLRKALTDGK